MREKKYRVYSVSATQEIMESRGSRTKFWVSVNGEQSRWLLKFPRQETGEHWAEKIAAEISNLIGVNCARVELASCEGRLATICESFISGKDDDANLEHYFFHGYEILEFVVKGYDTSTNLRFRQKEHNVKNIVNVLERVALVGSDAPMPFQNMMMKDLASYAILDGLVGNMDRHHENWMLMFEPMLGETEKFTPSLAPSFDHASSLGRELSDEKRQMILDSNGLLNYLQGGKARGGVFVDSKRKRALSPLRLAKLLCRWQPRFTRPALDIIKSVPNSDFRTVIDKMPSMFMSDIAKEFAYQVVISSKAELIRSIR